MLSSMLHINHVNTDANDTRAHRRNSGPVSCRLLLMKCRDRLMVGAMDSRKNNIDDGASMRILQ